MTRSWRALMRALRRLSGCDARARRAALEDVLDRAWHGVLAREVEATVPIRYEGFPGEPEG